MPTIKRTTTFAAGALIVNPLIGSQYEYLPFPAKIELAILADPGAVVTATFFSGTDVLLENSPVDEKPLTEPIQYPWDYEVEDVAAAGERLGLTIVGVATDVCRTVLRITPL